MNCTILDKIKLEEILQSLENEDIETGSIYELISQKTHKNQSTIKKFIFRIKGKINNRALKELGLKQNPKSKEFLVQLYKKINEKEDTQF